MSLDTPFAASPALPALRLIDLEDEAALHPGVDPLLESAHAALAGPREHLPHLSERLADAELDPSHLCLGLVTERHGAARLAGYLELYVHHPEPRVLTVGTIVMTPEARGTGLAAQAIELARRALEREHGALRLAAGVRHHNTSAQRFFEKLGLVADDAHAHVIAYREP
jgi:RimJ/RimL family protein N-acetyltransferase